MSVENSPGLTAPRVQDRTGCESSAFRRGSRVVRGARRCAAVCVLFVAALVPAAGAAVSAAGQERPTPAQGVIQVPLWDADTQRLWLWSWSGRWEPTAWWNGTSWVPVGAQLAQPPEPGASSSSASAVPREESQSPTPATPGGGQSTPEPAGRPAPPARRDASFTDSAGTTGTYHLLGSPAAVTGVLVYLDGDGMNAVRSPTSPPLGGSSGVVDTAAHAGYVTLVVRSPSGSTFWGDIDGNATFVADLTRSITSEVGTTRVALLGYSGGSQLITKGILPTHPQLCTDVAIMTGGGGVGRSAPAPAGSCRLVWVTGTDDIGANADDGYDAISDARAGSKAYTAAGWSATMQAPTGVGHEDIRNQLGAVLADHLSQ